MHDVFTEADRIFLLINLHVTVEDYNQYWTGCFRTVFYLKHNKTLINLKCQGPEKNFTSLTHFRAANIFVQGTVGHQAAEGKQLLPIKHDFE